MPHGLLVAALRAEGHRIRAVFRRCSRPTRSVFTFLEHAPSRRVEMEGRNFAGIVALSLSMILSGTPGVCESQPPTEGPAVGETPAWFLQGSFPDPTGRTIVDPGGHVTVPARSGGDGRG